MDEVYRQEENKPSNFKSGYLVFFRDVAWGRCEIWMLIEAISVVDLS